MNSVEAEIALALEHRGAAPGAVARAVEEVALAMGVERLLERRVDSLSGGELQRVALAAALAHRPELLVLDEPTSQLDPVAGDELVWLLRRLNEEWGTAVLMAEHRLERCLPAADRVVALDRGRVACDAPPQEFLEWAVARDGALATPAATLFSLAGVGPPPVSVKAARDALAAARLAPADDASAERATRNGNRAPGWWRRRRAGEPGALTLSAVWFEIPHGPTVLRDLDLRVGPGETIALMGRNGAGKSTLLRLAKGLVAPTRGRVERGGDVALLLQNPGDYLVHEHVADEAGPEGVEAAELAERAQTHPRDLSGGQRQRLALEVVLEGIEPAVVCLDEPTRGMDRPHKDALAARLRALAADGAAVIVATHDTEFAARLADRVVLMGQGVVIADAPAHEVLGGGWQFATDTARVLGEAARALTPEEGAAVLERELVR
jgi:energy-coupling factor transport system ATP-binding protein